MVHLLIDSVPSVEPHLATLRSAAERLRGALEVKTSGVIIERGKDPFRLAWDEGAPLIVTDGCIPVRVNGTGLYMLEVGDPIVPDGFPSANELPNGESDFAVIVDICQPPTGAARATLLQYLTSWGLAQFQMAHALAARSGIGSAQEPPSIQQFEPDQIIIDQGDRNDDVFTLVEGEAAAFVNGVQVGIIKADEIFGAIAALAGVPRTATVRATKRSIALRMPKDEFTRLMQSRPETVLRILQDMARALTNMNEKYVTQVQRIG